jgi:hypothetical protein
LGNNKTPQQCGNRFHIILETAEGHGVTDNPGETSGMTVAIKSWLQGKERKSLRQDAEQCTLSELRSYFSIGSKRSKRR